VPGPSRLSDIRLCDCMCECECEFEWGGQCKTRLHTHTLTHSHTHTLTRTLTRTRTHTHTHTLTNSRLAQIPDTCVDVMCELPGRQVSPSPIYSPTIVPIAHSSTSHGRYRLFIHQLYAPMAHLSTSHVSLSPALPGSFRGPKAGPWFEAGSS